MLLGVAILYGSAALQASKSCQSDIKGHLDRVIWDQYGSPPYWVKGQCSAKTIWALLKMIQRHRYASAGPLLAARPVVAEA